MAAVGRYKHHWEETDYFALLLKGEAQACSALEYLVDDLHQSKDLTVFSFLDHAGSEDLLWSLAKFLGNVNPRYALALVAVKLLPGVRLISLSRK